MAFLGGNRSLRGSPAPAVAGIFGLVAVAALILLFLSKNNPLPGPVPADGDLIVSDTGDTALLYDAVQGAGDDALVSGAENVAANGKKLGFLARIGAMWGATARNHKLETDLRFSAREIERWRSISASQAARIARYEALLRLKSGRSDEGFPAEVLLVTGGKFNRSLLANAGANAGLRRGDVAVAERGLAGRLVAVGRRSARILALTDPQSRAPVISGDRRVQAVLVGDSRPNPRLEFVTDEDALVEGQSWETSGLGGLFPRNIPVGTSYRGKDGIWRVRLAIDPGAVEFVRILRARAIPPPEDKDELAPQANLLRPFEAQTPATPVRAPGAVPGPAAPVQRPRPPVNAPAALPPPPPDQPALQTTPQTPRETPPRISPETSPLPSAGPGGEE